VREDEGNFGGDLISAILFGRCFSGFAELADDQNDRKQREYAEPMPGTA